MSDSRDDPDVDGPWRVIAEDKRKIQNVNFQIRRPRTFSSSWGSRASSGRSLDGSHHPVGRAVRELLARDDRASQTGNEFRWASTRRRRTSSEPRFELELVKRLDSMIDVRDFDVLGEASGDDPPDRAWTIGCRPIAISGTGDVSDVRFSTLRCGSDA